MTMPRNETWFLNGVQRKSRVTRDWRVCSARNLHARSEVAAAILDVDRLGPRAGGTRNGGPDEAKRIVPRGERETGISLLKLLKCLVAKHAFQSVIVRAG